MVSVQVPSSAHGSIALTASVDLWVDVDLSGLYSMSNREEKGGDAVDTDTPVRRDTEASEAAGVVFSDVDMAREGAEEPEELVLSLLLLSTFSELMGEMKSQECAAPLGDNSIFDVEINRRI